MPDEKALPVSGVAFEHDSSTGRVHDHSIPFSIQQLEARTWLVRENDKYGEYPNIFVKLCTSDTFAVLVLSDTGCATDVPNHAWTGDNSQGPQYWNIRSFLEHTLNPTGGIPYLVISTHCHYDHIMGIQYLPPFRRSIVASSHDTSFTTPYANLLRNSLCEKLGLWAPHYDINWVADGEQLVHTDWNGRRIPTNITILHTPGHTADSLSWYDAETRVLCVGDSFYERQSSTTRSAPWGAEPPMPTIFPDQGDLCDWWESLKKILAFVREKNEEISDEDYDYIPHTHEGPSQQDPEKIPTPSNATNPNLLTTDPSQPAINPHSSQIDGVLQQISTLTTVLPTLTQIPNFFHSHPLATHLQPQPFDPTQSYNLTQTTPPPSPSGDDSSYVLISHSHSHNQNTHSRPLKPRVRLAAAHVTVPILPPPPSPSPSPHLHSGLQTNPSDAETLLLQIQQFTRWLLRDTIPKKLVEARPEADGGNVYLWDDSLNGGFAKFSIQAPLRVVEEGRRRIKMYEWR